MSAITMTVGHRLRIRRQELGLSQEKAAELADLHPTYIGQLERGEKNATLESIEKICIALKYPLEDLLSGIVTENSTQEIARQCYDILIEQPMEDQKKLQIILEDIVKYKRQN